MEKSSILLDEQPAPGPSAAELRINERVGELGQHLARQAQLNGGVVDVLQTQLQVAVLAEHIQLLTGMVIALSAGRYDEDVVFAGLEERIADVIARMGPVGRMITRIQRPLPPRPGGSN